MIMSIKKNVKKSETMEHDFVLVYLLRESKKATKIVAFFLFLI